MCMSTLYDHVCARNVSQKTNLSVMDLTSKRAVYWKSSHVKCEFNFNISLKLATHQQFFVLGSL